MAKALIIYAFALSGRFVFIAFFLFFRFTFNLILSVYVQATALQGRF